MRALGSSRSSWASSSSSSAPSSPSSTSSSSSSSLSWSWLSHQRQRQQPQPQQQPPQPDCKSEVIAARRQSGAVIYGRRRRSGGSRDARLQAGKCSNRCQTNCSSRQRPQRKRLSLEGQLIDLHASDNNHNHNQANNDEEPSSSANQSSPRGRHCERLAAAGGGAGVQDEGLKCCCRLVGGDSDTDVNDNDNDNDSAQFPRCSRCHRRHRHRSSSLSSIRITAQQQLPQAPPPTRPGATAAREQAQSRQQQEQPTPSAINNATNCDRWQQISCWSRLARRPADLAARSDHHHNTSRHRGTEALLAYYRTTTTSDYSSTINNNHKVASTSQRNNAGRADHVDEQHLKSSSSSSSSTRKQQQSAVSKSCATAAAIAITDLAYPGAEVGEPTVIAIERNRLLIGHQTATAAALAAATVNNHDDEADANESGSRPHQSDAQYNDGCSAERRQRTSSTELPLSSVAELASATICSPPRCGGPKSDVGGGGLVSRAGPKRTTNSAASEFVACPSADLSLVGGQAITHSQPDSDSTVQDNNNNNHAQVMEILRKQHLMKSTATTTDFLVPDNHYYQEQTPINYPNNTLIVDLIKCHKNIAQVWPQSKLESSLARLRKASSNSCWPRRTRRERPSFSSSSSSSSSLPRGLRKFRPNPNGGRLNFQMPEPLARANIRLKSDVYDNALSVLTSDIRYQLHLLLYRRIQTIWLLLSTIFCMLIPIVLVANLELLIVLGAFCFWLSLQLLGAFLARQIRIKLDRMLEKSVAQVNSFFMEHNLMLGVINVGSFTREAKLNIPMVYFDTSQCREQIESIISINSSGDSGRIKGTGGEQRDNDCSGAGANRSSITNNSSNCSQSNSRGDSDIINSPDGDNFFLDYSKLGAANGGDHQYQQAEATPAPTTTTTRPNNVAFALAQSQMAKKILLRYSQRWISQYDKRKLMFADDNLEPRHLSTGKCLCQFIEEQLNRADNDDTETNVKTSLQSNNRTTTTTAAAAAAATATTTATTTKSSSQRQPVARFDTATADCQVVIDIGEPELRALKVAPLKSRPAFIPTLSRLVSLRENEAHRWSGGLNDDGLASLASSSSSSSSSTSSSSSMNRVSSRDPSETDHNRDTSLELGGDSIGRSDDLIKRLRLLLELRKDDLQGIGGSLFAEVQNKTPQFLSTFIDHAETPHTHSTGYTTADSLTIDSASHETPSPRTPPPAALPITISNHRHKQTFGKGKKIFGQRDGLFLLGMFGSKKGHHHHHLNHQKQQQQQQHQNQEPRDQIIEIC